MKEIVKILRIEQDGVIVETKGKETRKVNARLPKFARPGDFIRHSEHSFYDVLQESCVTPTK